MMGFMSTSLKVVNMAVSFLTLTRRRAMVLRREDIFSRRWRSPVAFGAAGVGAAALLDTPEEVALVSAGLVAALFALRASSLVILPPAPVPFTSLGSIPFSASILAATGEVWAALAVISSESEFD